MTASNIGINNQTSIISITDEHYGRRRVEQKGSRLNRGGKSPFEAHESPRLCKSPWKHGENHTWLMIFLSNKNHNFSDFTGVIKSYN